MKRPTISLCMIARDEEAFIGEALKSAKPFMDDLVVVDTGSTDETPCVAKDNGARVFSFTWCDDFSAARNESLKRARGDWILVIDADDRLLPLGGELIRRAVRKSTDHGYAFWIEEAMLGGRVFDKRVSSVRLFRNQPDIRYRGRIHEEVQLRNDRRLGRWSGLGNDALVRHYGNDPSLRDSREKHERNARLLRLELNDRPDDPHLWWLMVRLYVGMQQYEEAHGWLMRCRLADQQQACLMPSEREYLNSIEEAMPV